MGLHQAALVLVLGLGWSAVAPGLRAEGTSGPLARVQGAVDEVIAILDDAALEREARWRRIAEVIQRHFDFRSMSQSVVATGWKRASPEERRQFTDYFSQYIEATFRPRIEAYTDQRIEYLGERVTGDRAVVETEIVAGDVRTPVTYKLRRAETSGTWLAYDVVIEGVSLVANYRTTFSAILKSEGMTGLIADVRERVRRQEAAGPGAPR